MKSIEMYDTKAMYICDFKFSKNMLEGKKNMKN